MTKKMSRQELLEEVFDKAIHITVLLSDYEGDDIKKIDEMLDAVFTLTILSRE